MQLCVSGSSKLVQAIKVIKEYMKKEYCLIFFLIFTISCSNKNNLATHFENGLNPKDSKIELEIIYSSPKLTIFCDSVIHEIPNGYGENDWTLSYKDSLYCKFRHFKTKEKANHNYMFKFERKGDGILCQISIDGLNKYENSIVLDTVRIDN